MSARPAIPFDDPLDDVLPLAGEAARPSGWRAPTRLSAWHREAACFVCAGVAPYGYNGQTYCQAHVPDDWYPARRAR